MPDAYICIGCMLPIFICSICVLMKLFICISAFVHWTLGNIIMTSLNHQFAWELQNWAYPCCGFSLPGPATTLSKGPLKTSYRSLNWVVLFHGENTWDYITLTFASSCVFCIDSNLSSCHYAEFFRYPFKFQIILTTLLMWPWHMMMGLKSWGYQILRIQGPLSRIFNPENSGSWILKVQR